MLRFFSLFCLSVFSLYLLCDGDTHKHEQTHKHKHKHKHTHTQPPTRRYQQCHWTHIQMHRNTSWQTSGHRMTDGLCQWCTCDETVLWTLEPTHVRWCVTQMCQRLVMEQSRTTITQAPSLLSLSIGHGNYSLHCTVHNWDAVPSSTVLCTRSDTTQSFRRCLLAILGA